MNLHAVQHFHKSGIVVVYDLAVTQIQFGDFRHILLAEFKIPDIHILLHAVLVYGFGDYHHASLYVPPQSHLGRALSVFLTDLCQHRMGKDPVISLRKGAPCLRYHAVLLHQLQCIFLGEEGMQLHLIHCRSHLHGLAEIRQTGRIKVADADGTKLSFLVAVAECGTLSAAAEKLHLSQPALSRSMQKLEAELEVPLFTRRKNKIELNENARMAVEYARKILWQSQDMADHIRAFDLARRTIRVGSCAPAPLWDILPILSRLYPSMTISSEIREEEELLSGLRRETYQFVIFPRKVEEEDICCLRYEEEHLFFSLPPTHALSASKSLRLEDLNGETMLLMSDIGFWKKALEKKMPDTRFLIQTEMAAFTELVKASALPSFATDMALQRAEYTAPNRILIPISDPEANVTYYLLCPADRQRSWQKFLRLCCPDSFAAPR